MWDQQRNSQTAYLEQILRENSILDTEISWKQMDMYLQTTVKPVCNDHLYNKIHYLWFIQ